MQHWTSPRRAPRQLSSDSRAPALAKQAVTPRTSAASLLMNHSRPRLPRRQRVGVIDDSDSEPEFGTEPMPEPIPESMPELEPALAQVPAPSRSRDTLPMGSAGAVPVAEPHQGSQNFSKTRLSASHVLVISDESDGEVDTWKPHRRSSALSATVSVEQGMQMKQDSSCLTTRENSPVPPVLGRAFTRRTAAAVHPKISFATAVADTLAGAPVDIIRPLLPSSAQMHAYHACLPPYQRPALVAINNLVHHHEAANATVGDRLLTDPSRRGPGGEHRLFVNAYDPVGLHVPSTWPDNADLLTSREPTMDARRHLRRAPQPVAAARDAALLALPASSSIHTTTSSAPFASDEGPFISDTILLENFRERVDLVWDTDEDEDVVDAGTVARRDAGAHVGTGEAERPVIDKDGDCDDDASQAGSQQIATASLLPKSASLGEADLPYVSWDDERFLELTRRRSYYERRAVRRYEERQKWARARLETAIGYQLERGLNREALADLGIETGPGAIMGYLPIDESWLPVYIKF
ncbi:hypothetical protein CAUPRSCDRAFT_10210 [Caulochytrium protostelioides]|uniref:Uncharacterized protein n=1 Tax=Caulochytrium protostelioides TaxID=1555241 RepID=A0A4P9X0L2_9FUNG|nr:hypothetical protein CAUPRSCDRAFT_10210 [Caulochytrium protostelioides]